VPPRISFERKRRELGARSRASKFFETSGKKSAKRTLAHAEVYIFTYMSDASPCPAGVVAAGVYLREFQGSVIGFFHRATMRFACVGIGITRFLVSLVGNLNQDERAGNKGDARKETRDERHAYTFGGGGCETFISARGAALKISDKRCRG